MKRWALLLLIFVVSAVSGTGAWADHTTGGASAVVTASTLIIEVLPRQAEVRLDGHVLGIARDLVAEAVRLRPGEHVLQITAPGFLASTLYLTTTPDWASRVWVELVPERKL